MTEGKSNISGLARALRCDRSDPDHPVRHLQGFHCNDETQWGEGGDPLLRLILSLTLVSSTTILIVTVVQLRGADYI